MKLLVVSAFWVTGVAAALLWEVLVAVLTLFLVASGALALLFWLKKWSLLPPVAIAFLLLGTLRVELAATPPVEFQPWLGMKGLAVEGLVVEDPEPRDSLVRFRFRARRISTGDGWQEVRSDILVFARPSAELAQSRQAPHIRYGDILVLRGSLDEAPVFQDFDYREYLARQGIQALMNRPAVTLLGEERGSWPLSLVYRLRSSLARSLGTSLPEPQASFAQALLLGMRGGLPAEVTQAFRDTGTSHILAISGLHVGVVLGLSLPLSIGLLGRRRNLYLLLPLGLLWLYALLSAFSPSVERAVIMASLYLLAVALGRQRSAFPALGFAAALMVAVEPSILYDISFQLSFTAVAGILLLWRPLQTILGAALERVLTVGSWQETAGRWVVTGVAVSLAAVLATLPLLAFNFQYISFLSIPATLLVLPALPLVLVTSLATALAGLIAPALGQLVGWVAWLPLSYPLGLVELLSRLPQTVLHLEGVSGLLVWGYYGGAALALVAAWPGRRRLALWLRRQEEGRVPRTLAWSRGSVARTGTLLSLAVAVAILWMANASMPDGKLHVTLMDVGQGDAIFIQTPEGQQVVVDGGPDPRQLLEALGERMPFWDRSLDLVVVSHAHEDHLAGLLEVLRRYRVATILDNPYPYQSPAREEWKSVVAAEGATVFQARRGQVVGLGDQVTLEVLNPPAPLIGGTSSDVDNNSTVIRLRYGNASFLFTGDLQWEGEASIIDRGEALQSTVLKVAHHGSKTSSAREFLDVVRPQLVVVSVGGENPYGHPAEEVMDRLVDLVGSPENVLTTADRGDITLISDGRSISVQTQR